MARIPNIGPRARYQVLTETPTWVIHQMAAGSSLTGEAPATASVDANDLDPTVTSGKAVWSDLVKGGYFTLLGNYKRPIVVEAMMLPGGALTAKLVNPQTATERDLPGSAPFKIAPGEYIKLTGGDTGGMAAFLVREDIPAR